jgi:hypothetical protein
LVERNLLREKLAFAAGLFEGEGCFYSPKNKYAEAILQMTDLESIIRFSDIVGFGKINDGRKPLPSGKISYEWRVRGFEPVQALVAMLWPWLGARRKAKAIEVLGASKNVKKVAWGWIKSK